MNRLMLFILSIALISCFKYEESNEEDFNVDDLFQSTQDTKFKSSMCLATDEEVQDFISKNNVKFNDKINQNIKFIAGKCNPIVLVPGIYSTKLKVRLNCKELKRDEESLYNKIKLFCNKYVCGSDNDEEEDKDLWFNLQVGNSGFTLLKKGYEEIQEEDEKKLNADFEITFDWDNRYSGCLGFFMTIFNDKDECPIIESSKKRICGHSRNIHISFDGGFYNQRNEADCGVKSIENILSKTWVQILPEKFWKEDTNVFFSLVEKLEDSGYQKGFSLAGVPNDFRKFLHSNNFATESLKYHIENMYSLTGKPVIIVAHSFGNLVTLNALTKEKSLKDKIKKWISIAPPFAGATNAIDYFLHGIPDFNREIKEHIIRTEFHGFGQSIMLKSVPVVYELKPNLYLYNLLQKAEYTEFKEALKERISLENRCRDEQCSKESIEKDSINFNLYFKDYFPSLALDECKYESSVGGNSDALNKKCMTEIFNFLDYPSIIKIKSENKLNDTVSYDNNDYFRVTGKNYYYLADCDEKHKSDTSCTDDIFPEIQYTYDKYKNEIEDLLKRYNNKYKSYLDKSILETKEEIIQAIKQMIKYQKEKSIIRTLPVPPVDIDIVYSSFKKTMSAEFVDGDNADLTTINPVFKGGDGTVPTWSSLLTGLKWIYDVKKQNLGQKINLIEYCSRLASSDPKLPNFKPISCQCIENNVYTDNLSKCAHQKMLTDDNLLNYILDESITIEESEAIIKSKKNAIEKYSSSKDYLGLCNLKLVNLMDNNEKIKCSPSITISKAEFDSGQFCSKQGFSKMSGRECCSIYIHGYSDDMKEFDTYFCDNVQNDDESKEKYINDMKLSKRFFEKEEIMLVGIDCIGSNLIFPIIKKVLLLLLSLLVIDL